MRSNTRSVFPMVATIVAVVAAQTAAHADYIFATLEKGKVRFALMENANATPNPQFESYVTGITPQCEGKPLKVSATKDGAAYTTLPTNVAANKSVVVAEKVVGFRERGGEAYLLVYHAKGAATLAAAQTLTNAPAEVLGRRDGDKLVISVRQAGKPVAQSEVFVQWPGEEEVTSVKTDDKGEVVVPWPSKEKAQGGFISIRAKVNEAKEGEAEGKKYATIRRWATLTFPIDGPTANKPAAK